MSKTQLNVMVIEWQDCSERGIVAVLVIPPGTKVDEYGTIFRRWCEAEAAANNKDYEDAEDHETADDVAEFHSYEVMEALDMADWIKERNG